MNLISQIGLQLISILKNNFSSVDFSVLDKSLDLSLNIGKAESFGDLSFNGAMIVAHELKRNPREVAAELKHLILNFPDFKEYVISAEIAGPGFLNLTFTPIVWHKVANELLVFKEKSFKPNITDKEKVLVEFVSANPTGPLHLGTGRGGIIGDVLGNVLAFVGDEVEKEYYINDAGNQIKRLGLSLKIRCKQLLNIDEVLPESCYAGEYLVDLAKECVKENGEELLKKPDVFFEGYAVHHLLKNIKKDANDYGIKFNTWFSEKSLHDGGLVKTAIQLLIDKQLAYVSDGAIWFKSTEFGDDKDRVIQKNDETPTYIAADIAYHKNKFERGFTKLINVWGQDHHGYVKRLNATMGALGYPAENLDVILYQLVSIKKGAEALKMSKRAGNFTTLNEIMELVGTDIARYFYLNRKAEAHLEFDLEVALKQTDENPVYYIQYAYVRLESLLAKANEIPNFSLFLDEVKKGAISPDIYMLLGRDEISLIKKIISLESVLLAIRRTYGTHMLAYYVHELAKQFHNFYTNNRIIDVDNENLTKCRLLMVIFVKQTIATCLDLLGLSKPKKM